MLIDYEAARQKYKPDAIHYLLVAEAPPSAGERFFYFENVMNRDSLFLETMKVLYPEDCSIIKLVRARKVQFLQRFRADGFYLIDAVDKPIPKETARQQRPRLIQAGFVNAGLELTHFRQL